jgi:hypothetical protein
MTGASEHKDLPPEPDAREAERQALMRKRSIAIAVSLGLFALLFYIVTLVKFGSAIAEKTGS